MNVQQTRPEHAKRLGKNFTSGTISIKGRSRQIFPERGNNCMELILLLVCFLLVKFGDGGDWKVK
jgi:hypothetical protein